MSDATSNYAREAFAMVQNHANELNPAYKLRTRPLAFVVRFEKLEQELTLFLPRAWAGIRSEITRIEAFLKDCAVYWQESGRNKGRRDENAVKTYLSPDFLSPDGTEINCRLLDTTT